MGATWIIFAILRHSVQYLGQKDLGNLSGNGGTQFAKDRLLLWATIFSVRRSLSDQKRFYGKKKSLLKAWNGNIQKHSIEGEEAVTFTISECLPYLGSLLLIRAHQTT